jgi:hypothetical protein
MGYGYENLQAILIFWNPIERSSHLKFSQKLKGFPSLRALLLRSYSRNSRETFHDPEVDRRAALTTTSVSVQLNVKHGKSMPLFLFTAKINIIG